MRNYQVGEYFLTGAEMDVFYKLFWFGSQEDGDLPSKSGMDGLIDKELAVKCFNVLGEIIGENPNSLNLHGEDVARSYFYSKYDGMRTDIQLFKVEAEHQSRLLDSCEASLRSRDEEIIQLRNQCVEWRDRVNGMLSDS